MLTRGSEEEMDAAMDAVLEAEGEQGMGMVGTACFYYVCFV